jgi:hypothetical protein
LFVSKYRGYRDWKYGHIVLGILIILSCQFLSRALFPGATEIAETFGYWEAHTYLGLDSSDQIALANKNSRQATEQIVDYGTSEFPGSEISERTNFRVKGERVVKRFEYRTVIVVGGARGMGASHARGFVAEGANVVVAARQPAMSK